MMKNFISSIDSLRKRFLFLLILTEICRYLFFGELFTTGILLVLPFIERLFVYFGLTLNFLVWGYWGILFFYGVINIWKGTKKYLNQNDLIALLIKLAPDFEGIFLGAFEFSLKSKKFYHKNDLHLTLLERQTIQMAKEWFKTQDNRTLQRIITEPLKSRRLLGKTILGLFLLGACCLVLPVERRLFLKTFLPFSIQTTNPSVASFFLPNQTSEDQTRYLENSIQALPNIQASDNHLTSMVAQVEINVLLSNFCEQLRQLYQLHQVQMERLSLIENELGSSKIQILIDGQNEIAHLWRQTETGLEFRADQLIQQIDNLKKNKSYFWTFIQKKLTHFLKYSERDRLASKEIIELLGGFFRQNDSATSVQEYQKIKSVFIWEQNLLTHFLQQFDLLSQIVQLKQQRTFFINRQTDLSRQSLSLLKKYSGQNFLKLPENIQDQYYSLQNDLLELIPLYKEWENRLLTLNISVLYSNLLDIPKSSDFKPDNDEGLQKLRAFIQNGFCMNEALLPEMMTFDLRGVSNENSNDISFSDFVDDLVQSLKETAILISQNQLGKAIHRLEKQVNRSQEIENKRLNDIDPLLALFVFQNSVSAREFVLADKKQSFIFSNQHWKMNDPFLEKNGLIETQNLIEETEKSGIIDDKANPSQNYSFSQKEDHATFLNNKMPHESVKNAWDSISNRLHENDLNYHSLLNNSLTNKLLQNDSLNNPLRSNTERQQNSAERLQNSLKRLQNSEEFSQNKTQTLTKPQNLKTDSFNSPHSGVQPFESGNVENITGQFSHSFSSNIENDITSKNWGELPHWNQESVQNKKFSKLMPGYEEMIQQYFQRLEQISSPNR